MFELSRISVGGWIGIGIALMLGAVVLWSLLRRTREDGNRRVDGEGQLGGPPKWDSKDLGGSLTALLGSVEAAAKSATDWYWREKGGQARWSRTIQFSSIVLTSLAGLWPIITGLVAPSSSTLQSGLWSSLFVGVAAALLAIDRFFGFSSAWARYVLAATEIQRRLAEFRMDWLALSAAAFPPSGSAPQSPSPEQIAAILAKAKEFRMAIEGVVVQETKEWATEFQNNLAQLEKDVKAQLETLKAQVEQQQKTKAAADQPGALEATVTNADKTDGFTFAVDLDGVNGSITHDDKKTNTFTWTRMNLAPGTYTLTVKANARPATPPRATNAVAQSTIVIVKPGETLKPSITLPL